MDELGKEKPLYFLVGIPQQVKEPVVVFDDLSL
jgi:hypothetical protein